LVVGGVDVEFGEDGGVFVETGKGFDEHIVLVDGGVDLGDFIVGVGVGEVVFDVSGIDVEVVGFISVDVDVPLGLVDAKIAGDLAEFGIVSHLG